VRAHGSHMPRPGHVARDVTCSIIPQLVALSDERDGQEERARLPLPHVQAVPRLPVHHISLLHTYCGPQFKYS
jgi:hypothetical protein